MKDYLKDKRVNIITDNAEYKNYSIIKMDKYGIWFKKKRQGYFIPWNRIKIINFRYTVDEVEIVKIKVGSKDIGLITNQDIFESETIDDKTKNLIQLQVMYIDDKLYLSKAKAREILKNSKFPIKVNGRSIKDLSELTINEKMFLGVI